MKSKYQNNRHILLIADSENTHDDFRTILLSPGSYDSLNRERQLWGNHLEFDRWLCPIGCTFTDFSLMKLSHK